MDADKFKMLLEVIECGSLSAAAEKHGYTPSGISRMMSSLEDELGFSLLVRQKEGVRPTKSLDEIMPEVKELVKSGDLLRKAADRITGTDAGEIRIGVAYSSYYRKLSRAIDAIRGNHENIEVKVYNACSMELLDMMEKRELDLAILAKRNEVNSFEWKKLKDERITAIVPNAHRLAGRKAVPIREYENENYIEIAPDKRSDYAYIFARAGVAPNKTASATDPDSARDMVEAGFGISLYCESAGNGEEEWESSRFIRHSLWSLASYIRRGLLLWRRNF